MKSLWSRNRALILIGTVLAGVLIGLTVANRDQGHATAGLHPENPDPGGAQAVAKVLADHGVDVTVAHNEAQLLGARSDLDTTIMVTSTENLGLSNARRVLDLARLSGRLVIASPPPGVLDLIQPGLEIGTAPIGGKVHAACADRLVSRLTVDVPLSPGYRSSTLPHGCFPGTTESSAYSLVLRVETMPDVYVVGGSALFSNREIQRADNAAVALRLLGGTHRLIWYVADAADIAGGEGVSVSSLLPRWLQPAMSLVGVAVLALVWWRGRRLGPVAVEPLPVVVRAREAIEARGQLYRKGRDRAHTIGVLRAGTVERLFDQLDLPRDTRPEQFVAEVAAATGRSQAEIGSLLFDPTVPDDRTLVELANALTDLEQHFETVAPLPPQHKKAGQP